MATTPVDTPTQPLTMDEILPYIGEFGKFQILLEVAFCVMVIPSSMLILVPYFAQDSPPWTCLLNSTVCRLNGTFDSYSRFYQYRCNMPRSEWEFTKQKEYSIVTQFDLYCDTEMYSYLATSSVFISWAFGGVILGWVSDRYGRRINMLISTTFILLFGFISSFSPNIWFYIFARAVFGFFTPGTYVQSIVLISEFVGPKWRPFAGIAISLLYAVGVVILGVIAIFVQTWKTLMIVITAPYFFILLFFLAIPESARWLHVNGRNDEALAIFRKIAKCNGKELPEVQLKKIEEDCSTGIKHYLYLFKPAKIATRSLIQGYTWMVCSLVFFGVSFGAGDLSGHILRDYIITSLFDIPAAVLAIYLCNKIGRKKTTIIPIFIAGISCIAVSLIPKKSGSKPSELVGLRVSFGVLGRFCITLSYDAIYIWSTEMYPTCVRSAAMGYLQIFAHIGSSLAPWVAKWLVAFHVVLPFSIMGGLAVISAILLLRLPETANKETLETLADQFEMKGSHVKEVDLKEEKENVTEIKDLTA
ncbi:organic cation transporter-like protein isoform X1 [Rhopilema esculentum]|uniref:organic cation transporter-like protein isoform X1 n=1 Tax=Rhopilema esculentum TaxID=499914 RepID=UPI0031D0388B